MLAICAGTPGQCSATACIDLSKYPFMNTNTCICNSPALGQIASSAGSAASHYMRAAIGGVLTQHPTHLMRAHSLAPVLAVHRGSCLAEWELLDGRHLTPLRLAAGLFITYLGSSLLLARMSAEAAKVCYESSLLWTNKLNRYVASPDVMLCLVFSAQRFLAEHVSSIFSSFNWLYS